MNHKTIKWMFVMVLSGAVALQAWPTPEDYPDMLGIYYEGYAHGEADFNVWPTDALSYPTLVSWLAPNTDPYPSDRWWQKEGSIKAIDGTAFQGLGDPDVPQLTMTITGVDPAKTYDVYVVYWPKLSSWSTYAALPNEPLQECSLASADNVFFYDGLDGVQGCQKWLGRVGGVTEISIIVDAPTYGGSGERSWFDGMSLVQFDNSKAWNPDPADDAVGVPLLATLSWSPGDDMASNDVYLGTDETTVANATPASDEFMDNVTATTYDPCGLAPSTPYFWRIDTLNDLGEVISTGEVWAFTTGFDFPGQASDPTPVDSATGVSTFTNLTWTAGQDATSHDVYFGTTSPGDFQVNQTGTTYFPAGLTGNTTYYWRIDERNTTGVTTGEVWSFTTGSVPTGPARFPQPGNGAKDVAMDAVLSWTAAPGVLTHDIYLGTSPTPAYQTSQATTSYNPEGLAPGRTYYWQIDEDNGSTTQTGAVWTLTTAMAAEQAQDPTPSQGAVVIDENVTLSWTAGAGAVMHDVYMGEDEQDVLGADRLSPLYCGEATTTEYDTAIAYPSGLVKGQTYYWRIDELDTGSQVIAAGAIWSFTYEESCTQVTGPTPALGLYKTGAPLALYEGFLDPPAISRVTGWWQCHGSPFETEEITRELEEYADKGMGG
ncbi:MAG: hypothetical protein JW709_02645, partial [Sedimentisphaerales bacterium]|nr:hypothetical protein [Sedimentisphaerales bacterium]